MRKKFNHLDEYEFVCSIWEPEKPNKKHVGKVNYCARDGIIIEIYNSSDRIDFDEVIMLHGISDEIGKITIYGCSVLSEFSSPFMQKIKVFISNIVIGDHFDRFPEFKYCQFKFNNLDNFCSYLSSDNGTGKFQDIIATAGFCDGSIMIKKMYSGAYIYKDRILNEFIFHSEEGDHKYDQFVGELNKSISDVFKKYPKISSFLKKETEYVCELHPSQNSLKLGDFIPRIFQITNFFSVVFLKEGVPTEITMLKSDLHADGNEYDAEYPIISSMLLPDKTHQKLQEDSWNPFLNISIKDIRDNLESALEFWELLLNNPLDLIVNVIQGYITQKFDAVQHVVICISAMEQWFSMYEGCKDNDLKKYEYMIEKYASEEMKEKLKIIVPLKNIENCSIGEVIRDIRNIVLHPNGRKKYEFKESRTLDHATLNNLIEIFVLVLVRALFKKFGFPDSVSKRYGSDNYVMLREHSIISSV